MKGICKIFFIHWNQGKSSTFISHEIGRKSLQLGFKHQPVLLLTRSGAPKTKLQIFTTIQVPFWNRSRWDLKTITAEASDSDEFRENRLFLSDQMSLLRRQQEGEIFTLDSQSSFWRIHGNHFCYEHLKLNHKKEMHGPGIIWAQWWLTFRLVVGQV